MIFRFNLTAKVYFHKSFWLTSTHNFLETSSWVKRKLRLKHFVKDVMCKYVGLTFSVFLRQTEFSIYALALPPPFLISFSLSLSLSLFITCLFYTSFLLFNIFTASTKPFTYVVLKCHKYMTMSCSYHNRITTTDFSDLMYLIWWHDTLLYINGWELWYRHSV